MAIEAVLGKIVEAYGVEMVNQMTGEIVSRTGFKSIVKMDIPGTKEGRDLKYDLTMMIRRMRDDVDNYNDQVKDEYEAAMEPVLDKDGKPVMVTGQQGVPQAARRIPREKEQDIQKRMGEMLKTKKVTLADREKIVWPVMPDPKDSEKDPAKQRRILPGTDDMILTADFVDYEKACKG